MDNYCCVPMCSSCTKRNPDLSFHTFPAKGKQRVFVKNSLGKKQLLDRFQAWVLRLKVGKPVNKFMTVCSLHFCEDDYFCNATSKKRKILKKNAVPSKNLPSQNVVAGPSFRNARKRVGETCKAEESSCFTICTENIKCNEHNKRENQAAGNLLRIINSEPNRNKLLSFRDFQSQDTPVLTLYDLITSNDALNSFTGLNNFTLLNIIVEAAALFFTDRRVLRLTIRQRVLLTLTKLRCNLAYITLATLYGIPPEECEKYILDTLPILSRVLKPTIKFPDPTEARQNMPHSFSDFQDLRVVLDCTEILIQTPKCLCCRKRFYSKNKSHLTVKFMTGFSLGGLIAFISKPYGGRASDKLIFEQSSIITKLDVQDSIMVDKRFLIDDICDAHKIKLIRPPVRRQKKRLSAEEANFNAKIAAATVNIKESIKRLEVFKILSGKLQLSLVPVVEDIFTILCGIANLS